jgi:hypothetical protein
MHLIKGGMYDAAGLNFERETTMTTLLALPLLMTLANPQFDAAFCKMLTDGAVKVNAEKGSMVDLVTRNEGVIVSCNTKSVEFKKSLTVNASELKDGWQAFHEKRHNEGLCKLEDWAFAVKTGWSVSMPFTTLDGKTFTLIAKCD